MFEVSPLDGVLEFVYSRTEQIPIFGVVVYCGVFDVHMELSGIHDHHFARFRNKSNSVRILIDQLITDFKSV